MKTLVAVIFSLSVSLSSFAQSPFKEFKQADVLIMEVGVVTEGLFRILLPKELDEFDTDPARIPGFERGVIYNNSLQAHRLSNVVLATSAATALGGQFAYSDLERTGYITMETFLVTDVLTLLSKTFTSRTRPFAYNGEVNAEKEGCKTYDLRNVKVRSSFFSGHTSSVTAYNFLSASFFSHYHPDSDLRVPVWIAAGAMSSYVGYLRVRAGKHFPTDVVAGFLVGSATGFFIPRWHRSDNFDEEDGQYWRDLGLGLGSGLLTGILYTLVDRDPAPRQCENGLASKIQFDAGPTGFSFVYHF